MRKLWILVVCCFALTIPVSALDYTAPEAPDNAQELMPAETESFAEGLWSMIRAAIAKLQPDLASAAGVCMAIMAIIMLTAFLQNFPGSTGWVLEFAVAVGIGTILLTQSESLIRLGGNTVRELSEYGKQLIPVMTCVLSAQGGTTSAAALCAGTIAFDTFLVSLIENILLPMVYIYLALSVADAAIAEAGIQKLKDFVKWLIPWALKIVLYIFMGYMSITGVVSGSADAAAVKMTKMTISGLVPVVGGILADASEAVIVGAGVMRSAVGVYGVLAILATWILPFFKIGVQYVLLKMTGSICTGFGVKRGAGLVQDFSTAMGLLLGMIGTVSIMHLISTVCLMKGVA